MADLPIHDPKDFSEALRALTTSDPVHADIVNPLLERLINNDAFLKAFVDALAGDGRTTETVKGTYDALQTLISRLTSTTEGASGADYVKATPIAETGAADTVQGILQALINRLKSTSAGASGAGLVGVSPIAGQTGSTVQAVLESLDAQIDAHLADKANPHQVTAAQVGAAPASHVGSGGAAHTTATQATAGFMSAADKAKLDNLPDPAAGQVAGGISGLQIDAMYADPTAGPSQANVNGIPVISYAPDADQSASFSRLWGGHDDIRIEIGYFMDADNSGNVRLKISYSVNGGVFTDLFETITPGAGTAYRLSTLTSIIPAGSLPAGDNMISIKLARLGTDAADTHTGAFQLASLRLL